MKKIIALILLVALTFSMVSCDFLPDELMSKLNGLLGGEQSTPHTEHEFVLDEKASKAPTCTSEGYEVYVCSCGEKNESKLEPLGHEMKLSSKYIGNCDQTGSITYKCTRCKKQEIEPIKPTEHEWTASVESSRLVACTKPNCKAVKLPNDTGKYDEIMTFTFGDEEKAELAAIHEEISTLLSSAAKYDAALHGYTEEGELAEAYAAAEKLYEDYTDLIFGAQDQYTVAMTLYYCDNKNKELEQIYNDMSDYYTGLVAKYYELSQPWYDSMFREFFFYGATEEEINAFLFDSNALANSEYTELKNRNDAIELEFFNDRSRLPELYEEFVANNNRIAEILGYDNYLEYAYADVYDRDYTYEDVAAFAEYVKEYIVPVYNKLYSAWSMLKLYGSDVLDDYNTGVRYSFFENVRANTIFNDYIDEMNMAFTSNPDKQISFSDALNDLAADGNLFRGTYQGAYVTYLSGSQVPLAYFGKGYDNMFTVAHEFGHYMNEIYNNSQYNQSYDLLEMHSQGHESLLLYYLEDEFVSAAYKGVRLQQMLNNVFIIVCALQVDTFEQAVYLNSYDGPNSDVIMADGKITADEYDLLYASIAKDFGIKADYQQNNYWRGGMTITSPCYYVSYSISATVAIQVYVDAKNNGFEAAKESYLKLITYTDENPEMTMEEIIEYAGFLSYNDEQLYVKLNKLLMEI